MPTRKCPEEPKTDQGSGPRIIAHFLPQAWINDVAVAVDPEGPTSFDVTNLLDAWSDDEPRDPQRDEELLRLSSAAPDWIRNWNGPYELRLSLDTSSHEPEVGFTAFRSDG